MTRLGWFCFFVGIAVITVFAVSAARAQPRMAVCGEGHEMRDGLRTAHNEFLVGEGLTVSGAVVELFTARNGETWSLLLTVPGGVTCLIGAGSEWQHLEQPKPQPRTRVH